MVIIRLQRVGRRNHAEFRIVATESTRGPKSADFIELLGHYNPHTNEVTVDGEKVKAWIAKGAQVSDTMHNILVTQKVIEGKKKNVLPKKTPIIKEVPAEEAAAPAAGAEAPASAAEAEQAEAPVEDAEKN